MDARIWELLGGVPAIEIIDFLIEERGITLHDLERMYSQLDGRHRVGNPKPGGVIVSGSSPCCCRCKG